MEADARDLSLWERIEGGLFGMLVGDAVGVSYEFRRPEELPPWEALNMIPPPDFVRSYGLVPPGTWSDDGAQAMCLLASLLESGEWNAHDFADRLRAWADRGYMAVDGLVFDMGIQTGAAIRRIKRGCDPLTTGLNGERNNGNGSLMRVLPLALWHRGSDENLIRTAHEQSCVTHGHPRSKACCALYCLWARQELQGCPDAWKQAVRILRGHYTEYPQLSYELEEHIRPDERPSGHGSGYVVDCLNSARLACQEGDYRDIVRRAVSLGNDTDTTACVAGGIAGVRHGVEAIPPEWLQQLRGKDLLTHLWSWFKGELHAFHLIPLV